MASLAELGGGIDVPLFTKLSEGWTVHATHQAVLKNVAEVEQFRERLGAAGHEKAIPTDIEVVPRKAALLETWWRRKVEGGEMNAKFEGNRLDPPQLAQKFIRQVKVIFTGIHFRDRHEVHGINVNAPHTDLRRHFDHISHIFVVLLEGYPPG